MFRNYQLYTPWFTKLVRSWLINIELKKLWIFSFESSKWKNKTYEYLGAWECLYIGGRWFTGGQGRKKPVWGTYRLNSKVKFSRKLRGGAFFAILAHISHIFAKFYYFSIPPPPPASPNQKDSCPLQDCKFPSTLMGKFFHSQVNYLKFCSSESYKSLNWFWNASPIPWFIFPWRWVIMRYFMTPNSKSYLLLMKISLLVKLIHYKLAVLQARIQDFILGSKGKI